MQAGRQKVWYGPPALRCLCRLAQNAHATRAAQQYPRALFLGVRRSGPVPRGRCIALASESSPQPASNARVLRIRTSATPRLLLALPLVQSGIDISEELLGLFEEVKLRHKHKFIIFSLKQTGKVRGWPQNRRAGRLPC